MNTPLPLQKQDKVQHDLADAYGDITSHLKVTRIIRSHLTKKGDIRHIALHRLKMSSVRYIVDLGCGSGYFTEGLKECARPGATVIGIDVHICNGGA